MMSHIGRSGVGLETSIVIPAHNEEAVVAECLQELKACMDGGAGGPWEVIVVDDGSTDGTLEQLRQKKADVPELVIVRLDANHGQTAALDAGFRTARGRVIVTMDADMQVDPSEIPLLLEQIARWDVVCGVWQKRGDSSVRRISSRIANWTRNRLTHGDMRDVDCSLRAMKAECVAGLKLYDGMHRSLSAVLKLRGWSVTEVPVSQRPRKPGRKHYGIRGRLPGGLRDTFAVGWIDAHRVCYEIAEVIR